MGSFNDIVFSWKCPVCRDSAVVDCQLHHVSSFNGFSGNTYSAGTKLPWFPPDHQEFSSWRDILGRIDRSGLAENQEEEICYGVCGSCKAQLYVLIRVTDLTPEVIAVHGPDGPEGDDWGAGYTGGYAI